MSDTIIMYENGKAVGGEGHPTNADEITFDNTGTDLVSEEVESAIKEVNAKGTPRTDIATVESGTTASRAYSVGELVYVSGTLYEVKTAIASGATFTVGTNVEVTNVSDALMDRFIITEDISTTFNITAGGQVELTFPNNAPNGYKYLGVINWSIYVGTSGVGSILRQSLSSTGQSIVIGIASTVARTNGIFSGTVLYIKQ